MDEPTTVALVWVVVLASLLFLGSVASYVRLLMRRLTAVGARKLFQPREGVRIPADRERVGISISAFTAPR